MYLGASAFVITVMIALSPATAQNADGSKASPDAEKKICRRAVATGSMMAHVTCRTKAEWDALNTRAQSDLDRAQNQQRSSEGIQTSLGMK